MAGLNGDERGRIDRLARWVGLLKAETTDSLSIEMIEVLLLVAREPGLSVIEVAERMGNARATASRQLLDLSIKRRSQVAENGRTDGFGLIEQMTDPADLRLKRYRLSPKGERIAHAFTKLMGEGWR